jgi:hypothetical protein
MALLPSLAPMTTTDRPWLRYGRVPASIDYPRSTLYEAVAATAAACPGPSRSISSARLDLPRAAGGDRPGGRGACLLGLRSGDRLADRDADRAAG